MEDVAGARDLNSSVGARGNEEWILLFVEFGSVHWKTKRIITYTGVLTGCPIFGQPESVALLSGTYFPDRHYPLLNI